MTQRIMLWYRNDLRVADHEGLHNAVGEGAQILPVYIDSCAPDRYELPGNPAIPGFRRKFRLESLCALDQQWRDWNSALVVMTGEPEQVIPLLCAKYQINSVFLNAEASHDEARQYAQVAHQLQGAHISCSVFHGAPLIHPDDLPFELRDLPDIFTQYRKIVEARLFVRACFPTPTAVQVLPHNEAPFEPDFPQTIADVRSALPFHGGEPAGQARLHDYLWKSDLLCSYKETRNGLIGADYSSKFSAWLASGCMTPRQVFHEVRRYESERVANDSTYWMIFELLWRDYFRLVMEKFGTAMFSLDGISGRSTRGSWGRDSADFQAWVSGRTGNRFIDANMRELLLTGFMSNRGRQNVASYFVHELGLDWRLGALYFEAALVDYDVYSNWGNWAYLAGVGNDPRENRKFNITRQADTYDPAGSYQKLWLD
jgi:deoxyribodipyrimidine photo-lyase